MKTGEGIGPNPSMQNLSLFLVMLPRHVTEYFIRKQMRHAGISVVHLVVQIFPHVYYEKEILYQARQASVTQTGLALCSRQVIMIVTAS